MSTLSAENTEQRNNAEPALSRPFFLGDWQVLPELNRLQSRVNNELRQLEPRLVRLLCYLAANEDRVLTRDELVQELWPRVIVNENSLTRAVSELRKQLQSSESKVPNYIETIPKRGYRLIPRVELAIETPRKEARSSLPGFMPRFALPTTRWSAGMSAVGLCLILASWTLLTGLGGLEPKSDELLLSDEVLQPASDFQRLGGKLQLSTMEEAPLMEAIATPVVSLDEKQYAFIQYDTSGSTIFLGGLGTAIEPVPVYSSNRHLFNLAWSPVGNNLLFAMQPSITTAAVYSHAQESAELLMLNLNTLETSRLVEELNPAETGQSNSLNLT